MKSITGKIWNVRSERAEGSLLSRVLSHREIGNIQAEIGGLHNPFLMKDMRKAVERIMKAIENKERIMIFGDYDVDGVTSTSILFQALTKLEALVSVRIPNRFTDGYGLNMGFIEECKEKGVGLIITVDCGISNAAEVSLASKYGIDTIVTDHHHPPAILPFAHAVLNPHQRDCSYPFEMLCGAGVALKLIQALFSYGKLPSNEYLEYLDLVALATTADCMPIVGENRVLVKHGLMKLKQNPHRGLRGLMKQCGIDGKKQLSTYTLGFQLGPPINAAGRLDSALDAFTMLTSKPDMAEKLYTMNTERRDMVTKALDEVFTMIDENVEEKKIFIAGSETWGIGIIGLIAGKLTEKYHRPSIVMTRRGDELVGSARSISSYNIIEALTRHKELFTHFGGHEQAAGFSLLPEHASEFVERMERDAADTLESQDLSQRIHLDTELAPEEISFESIEELMSLEPFGMGNPTPLFYLPGVTLRDVKKMGSEGTHLSFSVNYGDTVSRGVAFGMGEYFEELSSGHAFDLAVSLDENEWQGEKRLQLMVKDMRVAS